MWTVIEMFVCSLWYFYHSLWLRLSPLVVEVMIIFENYKN